MTSPSQRLAATPIHRRRLIAAAAWSAPTVLVVNHVPAFATSVRPGDYAALFDTQGASTNQNDTNGSTWPHGILNWQDSSTRRARFQLGMQMMLFSTPAYDVAPNDVYKNWTSGPITVQVKVNTEMFTILTDFDTWEDEPDNNSPAWAFAGQTSDGQWTTLTFTHPEIAYNGNTLGMPTQTGGFEFYLEPKELPLPKVGLPAVQPGNGRQGTPDIHVTVSSGLQQGAEIPYVQVDSGATGL